MMHIYHTLENIEYSLLMPVSFNDSMSFFFMMSWISVGDLLRLLEIRESSIEKTLFMKN